MESYLRIPPIPRLRLSLGRTISDIFLSVSCIIVVSSCLQVYGHDYVEDLYNSVFRYGSRVIRPLHVRIALIKLDSFKTGLPGGDPRREEVACWLEAALNIEAKYDGQDDEAMLSHSERDKYKAQSHPSGRGEILNLQCYMENVRLERLFFASTYSVRASFVSSPSGRWSITTTKLPMIFSQVTGIQSSRWMRIE